MNTRTTSWTLLFVFAGGVMGTGVRHGVDVGLEALGFSILVTLLLVNTAGSLGLGWLVASVDRGSRTWSISGVGFLGSFTTFSAYTVSIVERVDQGLPLIALTFAVASIVVGWAAATVGRRLGARRSGVPR